ncbi:MAG TPA: PRC-barrel domain-containing protein [Longimicrobiaceae bacterium]
MNEAHPGLPEIFRTREFVGWEVVDPAGEKIGSVADLLIDAAGRVRYIDVEYGFPKKHILLPQDRMQWGERRLVADEWVRASVGSLPPYDPSRPLDGAMVSELSRAYPSVYDSEAHDWRAPISDARVIPLTEAKNFRLEKGAPDPRGWNVFGSDGERVGIVKQLLVDPTALKVRYAAVDVHDDLFRLRDDRHVLVPLEMLELKERGNDAWVARLTAAQVASLPAYPGGPVAPAMEMAVQRAFGGDGADKSLPPAGYEGEGEGRG